jgi:Na+/glutamate symporter
MNLREQGQQRVAAATVGLAVAGVLGSVGVAGLARAATEADRSGTRTNPSNSFDDSSNDRSNNNQDNGADSQDPFGGQLNRSDRGGHITSGGS